VKNSIIRAKSARVIAVALAAALGLAGCANAGLPGGAGLSTGVLTGLSGSAGAADGSTAGGNDTTADGATENANNAANGLPVWDGEWPPLTDAADGERPEDFPAGFPGNFGEFPGATQASGVEIAPDVTTALADNADYRPLAAAASQTWNANSETAISLTGGSATVARGATAGVQINGNQINITAPGTYRITGTLNDGQIVVDADDDGVVRLILDNANLTSKTGSPLAIMDADTTVIVLETGTTNSLTDAATYTDNATEANAALHAEDDLAITGTGHLTINANFNRGINAKDGLVISGANLKVTAVDDGIRGQDYVVILSGTINVTAEDDGIISNAEPTDAGKPTVGYIAILGGDVTVSAADDAITAEAEVIIGGGNTNVTRSYEGIEAANVLIAGGTISVVSADDGVNAASDTTRDLSIVISGGSLTVDAAGDGLDSNGVIHQTGGDVVIYGPTASMDSLVDADRGVTLDGGTLFAVGSAGMLVSPSSNSGQSWLVAPLGNTVAAGSRIEILDESGTVVASLVSQKAAAAVTYSGPGLTSGASYQIAVNGQVLATVTADQAAQGGRGGGRGGQGAQMPGGGQGATMPGGQGNQPGQGGNRTPGGQGGNRRPRA
jgi:hypothetical protein